MKGCKVAERIDDVRVLGVAGRRVQDTVVAGRTVGTPRARAASAIRLYAWSP